MIFSNASEIIPNLWIGDKTDAHNINFIREFDIRLIINCTKNIEFHPKYLHQKIRVNVDDKDSSNVILENKKLYHCLIDLINTIHTYLQKNQAILVHCYAGAQRSATVVAAYLIKFGKIDYKTAVKYIQTKRIKCFNPGINFGPALLRYEATCN